MPHNITQTSTTLSDTLAVPSDSIDPVNENSIDPVFQRLLNNDYYILSVSTRYKPKLQAYCSTMPTNVVTVNPYYGLWVATSNVAPSVATWVCINNPSPNTVSVTNLDTGTSFTSSTPYYIYAKYNGTGTSSFECSLQPPEFTLTFKTGDISSRYICSFVVDGAGNIVPFKMVDGNYYQKQSSVPFSMGSTTVNATTYITLSNYPLIIKTVSMVVDLQTTGTLGDVSLSFVSDSNAPWSKTIYGHAETGAANRRASTYLEVPTINNTFSIVTTTAGNNCSYSAYLNGYKE